MDELIDTLFILWGNSSAWLSRMWLIFHITVTAAETHHPPPHRAHTHWLASTNIQQAPMNVSRSHFFCMEEFNSTPLLHMHFDLSDGPSAVTRHVTTKCNGTLVGRFSLHCHTTKIHPGRRGPIQQSRRCYLWSSHHINTFIFGHVKT